MVSRDITIVIPSDEHIEELKKKGIDIEVELTRVVYDSYKNILNGEEIREIKMSIPKRQLHDLSEMFGIDGPGYLANTFKEQLHELLTGEKTKEN